MKVMTLEQIFGRLDDAFRLLTGRSRSALPRVLELMSGLVEKSPVATEEERAPPDSGHFLIVL